MAAVSEAFLAEISVRSPGKLFISIIQKHIFWTIVSKITFDLILKKASLVAVSVVGLADVSVRSP